MLVGNQLQGRFPKQSLSTTDKSVASKERIQVIEVDSKTTKTPFTV